MRHRSILLSLLLTAVLAVVVFGLHKIGNRPALLSTKITIRSVSKTYPVGTVLRDTNRTGQYQWFRCRNHKCHAIKGATHRTYKVQNADLKSQLYVRVRTRDGKIHRSRTTKPISGPLPKNVVKPSISGAAFTGSTLTANPGVWLYAKRIAVIWQMCQENRCVNTTVGRTHTLSNFEVGHIIRLIVTAYNYVGPS